MERQAKAKPLLLDIKKINMMKRLLLTVYIVLQVSVTMMAQYNLITTNPDFQSGINGWSASGDVTLIHDTLGNFTVGSAKNRVNSSDGDIRHATFNSETYSIPDSLRGNLLYFTFYAKASADTLKTRIRLWVTNSGGGNSVQKSSYLKLDTVYQMFSMPIHSDVNSISFHFKAEIGADTGTYWFDDFSMVNSQTDVNQINQFADNWKPRFFQQPDSVIIDTLNTDTTEVTVTITLYPNDTTAPVSYSQFGVNSNMRSGDGLVNRSHLYEQMGAFRFPAGSGSNIYFWDCNIPPSFLISFNPICGTKGKFLDPDHFLTFRNNADGEPTVVVNYFYARYGITPEGTREARVQQAADYAASWVQYYNIDNQAKIKYWEIGNECYGAWEVGYNVNGSIVTGKEYGEDLSVFATAMKAVDSTIRIGAVLSHNDFEWNEQVIREVENFADFLIVHHYFGVSNGSSANNATKEIEWDMQELQAVAFHNSSKPRGYFPISFTEFNIQGDPTTNMVNGLFIADALGTMVKNRFDLTTVWVNEWNINGNETHGILAKNDPDQANYTARPSFTPYYFYGKMFGDFMIDDTLTGNSLVKIYSSVFSSGELGVVLLNYSDTAAGVKINFGDTTQVDSVYWYSVYADNINAGNKKFYVNNSTSTTIGGGPSDLDSVPAFIAKMSDTSVLTIPKYSVNYIVLKRKYNGSPNGVWTGGFSGDWSTVSNWSDYRIPDSTTNVVIPATPAGGRYPSMNLNKPAVCKSILLEPGAIIEISSGSALTIMGSD
jgi:hypothetical protein